MKFRKCIGTCLALLVLVSNTGLAFNIHFCKGAIASISSAYNTDEACVKIVETAPKKCCASKVQDTHEDCCKNKLINLDEKSDDGIVKSFKFEIAAPYYFKGSSLVAHFHDAPANTSVRPVMPAERHSPPLFKLYSQFLLYA